MKPSLNDAEIRAVLEQHRISPYDLIKILSLYKTESRLHALLSIYQERGETRLRITHNELARAVCSSREKVTRAMGRLVLDGYVRQPSKKTVEIAERR